MADKKKYRPKNKRPGGRGLSPDARRRIVEQVWSLAGPICDAAAMELVHVEFQPEQAGMMLRLYIDSPQGVTLDDCTWVSRQSGDLFDAALECDVAYHLEVSSPGSNRPLGRKRDFEIFTGRAARIKIDPPIDGQKHFKGVLAGVSETVLQLAVDGRTVDIPIGSVVKANLVSDYGEKGC